MKGILGILFVIAPILPTFAAIFGNCTKMLQSADEVMQCLVYTYARGTGTRRLSAIA